MKNIRCKLVVPTAALLACVAVGLHSAPATQVASTALVTQSVASVAGLGFWDTLTCVGCIAGFVAGAGATVAGFAVFLAANPEIGILCVSSCIIAAT
jgi:hypothetical protein